MERITLNFDDGSSASAIVALPGSEGRSAPSLLLLHDVDHDSFPEWLAQNYAEEGYVVLAANLITKADRDSHDASLDPTKYAKRVRVAFDALKRRPEATNMGLIGYGRASLLALLAVNDPTMGIKCGVVYTPNQSHLVDVLLPKVPFVFHLSSKADTLTSALIADRVTANHDPAIELYSYPNTSDGFFVPATDEYDKSATLMAYSRTLAVLRKVLGPYFNLSAIWDQHTKYEFEVRDVPATMATMVKQPYVNHIPTMTGGVGHDQLARFYAYHFVHANPPDTRLIPVSRTIGTDRVVDEMLFCFTHTQEIDWMLPGVSPTGKYVEIPLVAIVNVRGDKLYHEHIYWDQASVLVQIGKLDPTGLPVAGIATAKKLLDPSLPSNELMANWKTSEDKPIPK
ncbi:carboxymethylenebutenolidase [Jimgerdemannia flammicorona]|uniref:Carboxymethylenebutenolidase n=1 Tax=Jimgerdemannia flammicorona TaxID=994334 RepID=A0A433DJC6_9FUNG|nr:carboxymethylenebutenolidase [Jimgerdemannia flammicorona]